MSDITGEEFEKVDPVSEMEPEEPNQDEVVTSTSITGDAPEEDRYEGSPSQNTGDLLGDFGGGNDSNYSEVSNTQEPLIEFESPVPEPPVMEFSSPPPTVTESTTNSTKTETVSMPSEGLMGVPGMAAACGFLKNVDPRDEEISSTAKDAEVVDAMDETSAAETAESVSQPDPSRGPFDGDTEVNSRNDARFQQSENISDSDSIVSSSDNDYSSSAEESDTEESDSEESDGEAHITMATMENISANIGEPGKQAERIIDQSADNVVEQAQVNDPVDTVSEKNIESLVETGEKRKAVDDIVNFETKKMFQQNEYSNTENVSSLENDEIENSSQAISMSETRHSGISEAEMDDVIGKLLSEEDENPPDLPDMPPFESDTKMCGLSETEMSEVMEKLSREEDDFIGNVSPIIPDNEHSNLDTKDLSQSHSSSISPHGSGSESDENSSVDSDISGSGDEMVCGVWSPSPLHSGSLNLVEEEEEEEEDEDDADNNLEINEHIQKTNDDKGAVLFGYNYQSSDIEKQDEDNEINELREDVKGLMEEIDTLVHDEQEDREQVDESEMLEKKKVINEVIEVLDDIGEESDTDFQNIAEHTAMKQEIVCPIVVFENEEHVKHAGILSKENDNRDLFHVKFQSPTNTLFYDPESPIIERVSVEVTDELIDYDDEAKDLENEKESDSSERNSDLEVKVVKDLKDVFESLEAKGEIESNIESETVPVVQNEQVTSEHEESSIDRLRKLLECRKEDVSLYAEAKDFNIDEKQREAEIKLMEAEMVLRRQNNRNEDEKISDESNRGTVDSMIIHDNLDEEKEIDTMPNQTEFDPILRVKDKQTVNSGIHGGNDNRHEISSMIISDTENASLAQAIETVDQVHELSEMEENEKSLSNETTCAKITDTIVDVQKLNTTHVTNEKQEMYEQERINARSETDSMIIHGIEDGNLALNTDPTKQNIEKDQADDQLLGTDIQTEEEKETVSDMIVHTVENASLEQAAKSIVQELETKSQLEIVEKHEENVIDKLETNSVIITNDKESAIISETDNFEKALLVADKMVEKEDVYEINEHVDAVTKKDRDSMDNDELNMETLQRDFCTLTEEVEHVENIMKEDLNENRPENNLTDEVKHLNTLSVESDDSGLAENTLDSSNIKESLKGIGESEVQVMETKPETEHIDIDGDLDSSLDIGDESFGSSLNDTVIEVIDNPVLESDVFAASCSMPKEPCDTSEEETGAVFVEGEPSDSVEVEQSLEGDVLSNGKEESTHNVEMRKATNDKEPKLESTVESRAVDDLAQDSMGTATLKDSPDVLIEEKAHPVEEVLDVTSPTAVETSIEKPETDSSRKNMSLILQEIRTQEMGCARDLVNLSESQETVVRLTDLLLAINVLELIYWRDVKKTGVVFGSMMFVLLSLSMCSLLSVLAYLSLAILTVTFSFRVYKNVMQAVQKTNEGHPFKKLLEMDIELREDVVQNAAEKIACNINCCSRELRRMYLVGDYIDSLKFGLLLWLLTYVGAWFNGMTLVILAVVSIFTLPKVYETYQGPIDQNVNLVRNQLNNIMAQVSAKIPFPKKKVKAQ